MSEEDKIHLEAIEEIVGRKVDEAMKKANKSSTRNLIVIAGMFITIFLGVYIPLNNSLVNLIEKNPIGVKEAYDNFLQKKDYHLLQKDEHVADVEAIQNPSNASNTYMRHNIHESERLEIKK